MSSFKDWLISSGISKNASDSINSRINRIKKAYLLEYEFSRDGCASLLEDFNYTADDANNGIIPNINIEIKGNYLNGIRSMRSAIILFVKYLTETQRPIKQSTSISNSCVIECSFSLFNKFTGPAWCKKVQTMTKAARKKTVLCECCQQNKSLDAAHKRHLSRLDIIKKILDENYAVGKDLYRVNLVEFEKKFVEAHKPFEDTFYFLCSDCHDKYDSEDIDESNKIVESILANKL